MTLTSAQNATYQAARQKRLRDEWLVANGPCKRCGSSEHMEVDHIDPATKTSHRIWSWSKERREAELKKCQVLCRACHEKKSAGEKSIDIPHGTVSGYRYFRCRCDDCRAAHNAKATQERAAKRGDL